MKRIAELLAAILLLISSLSASVEDNAGRIEGPGFDTPEEAVTAYIEAFQRNDLNAMLSTFAVESFVEHYDLENFVEQVRSYSINTPGYIPNLGEYSAALNLEYRRFSIVSDIRYQYLSLIESACIDGYTHKMDENASAEAFLNSIFPTDDQPWLSTIEFNGEVLEPNEIEFEPNYYYTEVNQHNIALWAANYGAPSFRSLAAMLKIRGEPYVLCMDVICYEGRWYNLTLNGNLGNLMHIYSLSGGLSPYPIPERD